MCKPEWRRARVQAQRLADLARLRRVRDRIDREYAQPLNVEALAHDVNMSAGHLSRQFRAAYGESPYAYLMTRRIERAAALLRRGDLSVTEVCFEVGCASLGTFTTRFTELVGMSPGVFRRQAADASADRADAADAPADRADAVGTARDAGTAIRVEGMPACVAKQVSRPVRNREAPGAPQPLA
ncbi:helix-turn-helix transcriptional regulator [Kitasatospora sp. RG8]|uniref:helix-turn-helix transcriptional regulator n=1 Tax=Kitasatospora sp. RG8 TaxID=2820815 RepID=UPI001AE02AA7|nr:helix-turn-helix transcriptional regulator [Kitasatospora sp. RG8]MBP0451102.1 helix-turn-helix transcriptional regulator [Kitasatospora sp. RG8]